VAGGDEVEGRRKKEKRLLATFGSELRINS
jgi:hypothetical protein